MIRIENLTKKFGDLCAVNNLDLNVKKGEFFAFLGPNGAGKTTTIKTMTGLLVPTEGRVLIGGYDIQKDHMQAKRRIGYIPDHPYLYEKLTGRDFFYFVGNLYGIEEKIIEEKINYYAKVFSLSDFINDLIENYSHGMRQKLIFATMFMHEPEVLIIDEPMVGLDPASAKLVKNMLKNASREGKTVFLSTHTLSVAEELADRIGIINHGKLIFLGDINDLKTKLKSTEDLEALFLKLTEEESD